MKNARIAGFDLARGYAIFGMYIVNFNLVFGQYNDPSVLGQFLMLFNGNSSSTFVVLAGMGLALMTNRAAYTTAERQQIRRVVLKRSLFLFVLGLLLSLWWPADILHFYGAYMKIALLLLFVPRQYLLWAALLAIVIFHALFAIIPFERGWDFNTLQYTDFWTLQGLMRSTFYNGWNPVFPWIAYFLTGMWLGRLDWNGKNVVSRVALAGALLFVGVQALQLAAQANVFSSDLKAYVLADYLPPFLPFLLGTVGFSLLLISACVRLGQLFPDNALLRIMAQTGRLTLTHYIVHLTLGLLALSVLSGRPLAFTLSKDHFVSAGLVLAYAVGWFVLSAVFSHFYLKKYKNGPFEALMRRFSDN